MTIEEQTEQAKNKIKFSISYKVAILRTVEMLRWHLEDVLDGMKALFVMLVGLIWLPLTVIFYPIVYPFLKYVYFKKAYSKRLRKREENMGKTF